MIYEVKLRIIPQVSGNQYMTRFISIGRDYPTVFSRIYHAYRNSTFRYDEAFNKHSSLERRETYSFPHEHGRIGTLPPWVRVWEDLPDVWQPQRAENRVHHAVQQHVPCAQGEIPQHARSRKLGARDGYTIANRTAGVCEAYRRSGPRSHGRGGC